MAPFLSKTIDLQPDDVIYAFSDGYADQFGGPKGKKFMYRPFKELLLSLRDKPMEEQKEVLNQRIEEWMAYHDDVNETDTFEQVDDVLIIGVRF
jgi:serine phosphatase RsbU (regulator of sigma subunit)